MTYLPAHYCASKHFAACLARLQKNWGEQISLIGRLTLMADEGDNFISGTVTLTTHQSPHMSQDTSSEDERTSGPW